MNKRKNTAWLTTQQAADRLAVSQSWLLKNKHRFQYRPLNPDAARLTYRWCEVSVLQYLERSEQEGLALEKSFA
jgi:hypothetical protein